MSLSPSRMENAQACIRIFAWDEVDRRPYVQGPEAALGGRIHQVGEDYHVRGKAPDENTPEGKIFMPALPYVPVPRTGHAEGKFEATISGVEYGGIIDLSCLSDDLPGAPAGLVAVLDYKSVKALTADKMLGVPRKKLDYQVWLDANKESFLRDIQALIYAGKRLIQAKEDRVFLRWLYLRRCYVAKRMDDAQNRPIFPYVFEREGTPKAEPRDTVLTRAEVIEAFGRLVHPLAQKLIKIRREKTDPLSLPPNPSRCMLYGKKYPCPRIGQCNLDPLEELSAMDLLDELEQETKEVTPHTAPTLPVPPPVAKSAKAKAKGINPEPLEAVAVVASPPANDGTYSDADLGKAVRVILSLLR